MWKSVLVDKVSRVIASNVSLASVLKIFHVAKSSLFSIEMSCIRNDWNIAIEKFDLVMCTGKCPEFQSLS